MQRFSFIQISFALALVSCGESPKPEQDYTPPTSSDMGFWDRSEPVPSWFVPDGSYASDCLSIKSFDARLPAFSQKLIYTIRGDLLEAERQFYSSGCAQLHNVKAYSARVSHASRRVHATTQQSLVSYIADMNPARTKRMEFITQSNADLLNKYKICGKEWMGEQLNSTLELSKEKCKADAEAIPEEGLSLERVLVGNLVNGFFDLDASGTILMTVGAEGKGLRVVDGFGLELDSREYFFRML